MFKVSTSRSYTWPVSVREPVDGGRHTDQKFIAKFMVLPQDELDAILLDRTTRAQQIASGAEPDQDTGLNLDIMKKVLVGWGDIVGDDKREIPLHDADGNFTSEAITIMQVPYIMTGLIKAYFDSISGKKYLGKN